MLKVLRPTTRGHDDRNIVSDGAHLPERVRAVHAGHFDVHNHNVYPIVDLAEQVDPFHAIGRFDDGMTLRFEKSSDEPAYERVVVDNQNNKPVTRSAIESGVRFILRWHGVSLAIPRV